MTTGIPAARIESATRYALAIMRVMAPMPTSPTPSVDNELDQFGVAHRSCVAVDQNNFMAGGRERLQQKHPEVRHEVLRDAIVGIVEKDFQFAGPERQPLMLAARLSRQIVR